MVQVCILRIFFVLFNLYFINEITADRPCVRRYIKDRSPICVCNATYCDEVTRVVPCPGQFVTYTTSAAGSRLKKGNGKFQSTNSSINTEYVLTLDVNKKYQTIQGFGGAVTDSSSILWKGLPKKMQQFLIDGYYSKTGLEYNFARIPMGCSDFSVRRYTYADCEGPKGDKLKHFSLQKEDIEYKMVMMKEIMKVATAPVYVVGSIWTPPRWMTYVTRTNPKCGFLKPEYYQLYADYMLKFVESYEHDGIPIYALTTGNEPSLSIYPDPSISCLGWGTKDLGDWIVNNFGPTIRNSKFKDIKLLGLDDQRYTIKLVFDMMVKNNSKVLDYLDGLAVHYYADSYVSPDLMSHVTEKYPKLFVISTESAEGLDVKGVDLGAWRYAKKYMKDIIQDFTHDTVGWIDWNLCLNPEGGPNVEENFVDSPVIVDLDKKEFYKQPMFYALGQISKFVPRGSVRISTEAPKCSCSIVNVAFLTPRNTIVVVLQNMGDASSVTIRNKDKQAKVSLEANSITTVEFLNYWSGCSPYAMRKAIEEDLRLMLSSIF